MEIGRETTDLDFLLTRMKAEKKGLKETFEQIISVPSEDGFNFTFDSIDLLRQPHLVYPGYRVTLKTEMGDCAADKKLDIKTKGIRNFSC